MYLSLLIYQFPNVGVDPNELRHFLMNLAYIGIFWLNFIPTEGATSFFTSTLSKYAEFLTFHGGLSPVFF